MKRRDEVLVGVLLTVAVAILVLGTLWLARGGLSSGYPLRSRFTWGQNLKQGQPVLLAGVTVGYVDEVQLQNGGYLDVTYRIYADYHIPKSATASVISVGIFGDVAVALNPKDANPPFYEAGELVPTGPSAPGLAQIIGKVDSITTSVTLMTTALNQQLIANGGLQDIRKTLASTQQLAVQLNTIAAQQNRNLTATLGSLQRAVDRASGAIDPAVVDSTIRNLRTTSAGFAEASRNLTGLTTEITQTTTRLNSLLGRLDRGEGTAGKLLTDSLLYRDIRSLTMRLDTLTMDFKANPRKYINLSIFGR